MKYLGWTIAVFLGISLDALAYAQGPRSPIKYVLNSSGCTRPGPGLGCSDCAASVVTTAACPGSGECVAIRCTGGTAVYDACDAGAGSAGPCGSGTPVARACTPCSMFSGTPASCLTGGTCSTPGCVGTGAVMTTPATISPC